MTVRVFQQWLEQLDRDAGASGCNIVLLLDNAPVHIDPATPL